MDKIERIVVKETQRVIKLARRMYPVARSREIIIMPKELDYRFVGLASFRTKTVFFNRMYIIPGNLDVFVSEVIPHEIAHLVSDWVYPDARYVHGKEWKEVCTELGGVPRSWVHLVQQ